MAGNAELTVCIIHGITPYMQRQVRRPAMLIVQRLVRSSNGLNQLPVAIDVNERENGVKEGRK